MAGVARAVVGGNCRGGGEGAVRHQRASREAMSEVTRILTAIEQDDASYDKSKTYSRSAMERVLTAA